MASRALTLALTCALTALAAQAQLVDLPRPLGELNLDNAAFVEVYTAQVGDGDEVARKTLYVSSFNPGNVIGDDKVYYLRAPGQQLDSVADWDMKVCAATAYPHTGNVPTGKKFKKRSLSVIFSFFRLLCEAVTWERLEKLGSA